MSITKHECPEVSSDFVIHQTIRRELHHSDIMSDHQDVTNRFLDWFKSMGGEFRDDLLEIQDLRSRDAGRGISTCLKDHS